MSWNLPLDEYCPNSPWGCNPSPSPSTSSGLSALGFHRNQLVHWGSGLHARCSTLGNPLLLLTLGFPRDVATWLPGPWTRVLRPHLLASSELAISLSTIVGLMAVAFRATLGPTMWREIQEVPQDPELSLRLIGPSGRVLGAPGARSPTNLQMRERLKPESTLSPGGEDQRSQSRS